jgi:hypothetical protein
MYEIGINMTIQSISEISREGLMRGTVVSVDDPQLEGRIALHVPKLVTKHDPRDASTRSRKQSLNTDIVQNDDFKDLIASDVETVNYIWFRPKFQHSFRVPYVGTVVDCYFEDGDPQKPYYNPLTISLNGEVTPMTKLKNPADKYEAKTKPFIHVLEEFKDGTIVYHNENKPNKRFAITFQNNHSISINENEKENSIELVTESGHMIVLDQKNKHITAKTAEGHIVKMDDVAKSIALTTIEGHKILMDDPNKLVSIATVGKHTVVMDDGNKAIALTTTGGHKINMDDNGKHLVMTSAGGNKVDMDDNSGFVTTTASSGGKMAVGGGKVQIN